MKQIKAVLKQVSAPQKDCAGTPVGLSDETIAERKQKVLAAMKARGLDQLIVYGDVEHGGNFEYLVGYFTRFDGTQLLKQGVAGHRRLAGMTPLRQQDAA